VLAEMSASTAFAATIRSDVLKVLQAKENLGLLAS
jgi:hypothetical protein